MPPFFEVKHRSSRSKARTGVISTSHGLVQTPAFVPVGTKATIKAFDPQFIQAVGIQLSFVNTYHLVTHPGVDILEKAGGVHSYSQLNIPLMSDSGGFQVFSLANKKRIAKVRAGDDEKGNYPGKKGSVKEVIGKVASQFEENETLLVKISKDGVVFRSLFDGTLFEFTPEKSMEYQQKIGADMMMAFDECTYYPATHEYAAKAMNRTHDWLLRCITKVNSDEWKQNEKYQQYLFGIIQGGTFEDLRKQSAEFICKQNVDGVAIGGVSVGETKSEMREQVSWVAPYLPDTKPVHLLGVGQIDDVIELVNQGIDTFDCVEPTRVARMGKIYQWGMVQDAFKTKNFSIDGIDIDKGKYKADLSRLDESCDCYVCTNFTKSYLHHLLKQKELLGYTLGSYHNLVVMEKLMTRIRKMIECDEL